MKELYLSYPKTIAVHEKGARGAAWIARRPSKLDEVSRRSGVQIPAGPLSLRVSLQFLSFFVGFNEKL